MPPKSAFSTAFPWPPIPPAGGPGRCTATAWSGAGRDNDVDSGGGTELYVVIGQAPRHLDRNVTLLGRVVQGMELLAVMPRGSGALGFYEHPEQRVPIKSLRVAADVPLAQRTELEVLRTDTPTFAAYVAARRNRLEEWFKVPAGHVDVCNVPLPVRGRAAGARSNARPPRPFSDAAGRRRPPRPVLPLRTRVIDHFPALRRGRVSPPLLQHLAPLRRQLLKAMEVLPHDGALVRRQGLELLPAAAQRLALLRRQGAPAREAILCLAALLGRHAQPAFAAARQRLLPLGRQACPTRCRTWTAAAAVAGRGSARRPVPAAAAPRARAAAAQTAGAASSSRLAKATERQVLFIVLRSRGARRGSGARGLGRRWRRGLGGGGG